MKKNIMIISNKLSNGGAERVAANLSYDLSKKYNVYLVLGDTRNADYVSKVKTIQIKELRKKDYKKYIGILKLKFLKKFLKIDVSISIGNKPNMYNVLSKCKEKNVISIRNYISMMPKSYEKEYKGLILKKAEYITAVSKAVAKDQEDNFNVKKNRIKVIYNYCDKEYISNLLDEKIEDEIYNKIFKDSKVYINIGRLNKQKMQFELIKAFSKVSRKYSDAKLVILGRGKEESTLKELICKLGLEKNVFLLGFEKNPYKYLAKSYCFLMTSYFEGMPNTMLEAMSVGLPVISTDSLSGPKEILAPSLKIDEDIKDYIYAPYGIITKRFSNFNESKEFDENLTNEEILFADAIEKIHTDESLRNEYSLKSLERIKDFSKENILKEWEDLIEK